jgi:hypothetical protein
MGYASRSGRAVTSSTNPRAFAVCDRCGFWYNHHKLAYQWEWAGTQMQNTQMLVCPNTCLDIPNPQLKSRMAPPDPVPIRDPRPENFLASRWAPASRPGNDLARFNRTFSPAVSTDPSPGTPIEIE